MTPRLEKLLKDLGSELQKDYATLTNSSAESAKAADEARAQLKAEREAHAETKRKLQAALEERDKLQLKCDTMGAHPDVLAAKKAKLEANLRATQEALAKLP